MTSRQVPVPRAAPSDEIDTIAYAVSFLQAAKKLSGPGWEDNHPLVVPFYMLIGFSIENGFKAILEQRKTAPALKWSHSHDLTYLRQLCAERMILLDPVQIEFVDRLSPMHKEHHFRYPQKAGTTELDQPSVAIWITNGILRCAFRTVSGPSRIDD
jgi:hypothetical protein